MAEIEKYLNSVNKRARLKVLHTIEYIEFHAPEDFLTLNI